jgi:asparagine synthase (glutamine-hydrolysing)
MCGLTGFWGFGSQSKERLINVAQIMADALFHRGPNDVGAWADAQVGLALGHRRLSIVDLSSAGHQPMASLTGRFVLVFNGEIYNHLALRDELESRALSTRLFSNGRQAWRGHSDTETLLACFEAWGVEETLRKSVGMFALALWDSHTQTLALARDRLGEKPLYYGWTGQGDGRALVFGSELKALRAYPGFDNSVCRQALAQYMRFMVVPGPMSIYKGIYKLEAGCLLTVSGRNGQGDVQDDEVGVSVKRWWALADAVRAGQDNPIADEAEAVELLEQKLAEAVRLQSLADVPLGAFLSGGVDSSAIVALMQQQAKQSGSCAVKTFTIGFEEAGFDESPHACAVAQHLGTQHHAMCVTAQMAQDLIPTLPWMYDEPFADSSQIPTNLVCKAARQHVTVALSGDAGDELFGGYNRYFWGPRIWDRLRWMPFSARRALGAAIASVPVSGWDALAMPVNAVLPGMQGIDRIGEKAHKLAARLRHVRSFDDLYLSLVTEWQDPGAVVKIDTDESGLPRFARNDDVSEFQLSARNDDLAGLGNVERMMFMDSVSYLPDDILCKVDRAAMACSLETRVPFLDHRVVELAWRLPLHMKVRGNSGKWALRQVLYKYVPKELIERPKAGFAIPIGQWLRGPLRDWAEALLSEQRLQQEGYFHSGPIRRAWAEHLAGTRDNTAKLWAVLMFQAWLEAQG